MAYKISDKCIACGACAANCPAQCIKYNEEKNRYEIDPEQCLSCGMCASVCPVDAPSED